MQWDKIHHLCTELIGLCAIMIRGYELASLKPHCFDEIASKSFVCARIMLEPAKIC
jgi:hypothetical protein